MFLMEKKHYYIVQFYLCIGCVLRQNVAYFEFVLESSWENQILALIISLF